MSIFCPFMLTTITPAKPITQPIIFFRFSFSCLNIIVDTSITKNVLEPFIIDAFTPLLCASPIQKNMYCRIVWNIASFTMFGTLDFVGSSIFLLRILPIKIVSTPAKTNLVPANNTCVHVSLDGILNNAYPNLIQGDALPQRNVHTSARAHTTHVFCKKSFFSFVFSMINLLFF